MVSDLIRTYPEILHFGGDLRIEAGGVEQGDFADPAFPGDQVLPEGWRVVAQRSDRSKTGDDYPAFAPITSRHKIEWGSLG